MSNKLPSRLSPVLLVAWTCLVWGPLLVQADEPRMRLRLKDGSFSRGTIVPSSSANCLGWKADGFAQELEFDLAAVRSVTTIARLLPQAGQEQDVDPEVSELPPESFYFDLTNGSLVAGQLLEMDEKWVTVKSALLGDLKIERGSVRALSDAQYVGQVLYRGPVDDQKWQSASDDDAWAFEAGALRTAQQGAVMIGDVALPAKAQVNVVLAWEGVADFVFSFGTTATNQVSTAEQVPAAARLEVWDKQLALVREVDGGADIALVSDLTGASPRIELSLFIDQEAGVVTVCDSHGRPLDSVKAVGKRTSIRNAVHLVNHGPSLTLEHFEVREWDGLSTQLGGFADGRVILEDGTVINGAITGFDPEAKEVLIREAQSEQMSRMVFDRIRRADFLPLPAAERRAPNTNEPKADLESESDPAEETSSEDAPVEGVPSETATSIERVGDVFAASTEARPQLAAPDAASPTTIELILADRTRLRGQWLPAREGLLRLRPEALQSLNGEGSVVFPPQAVRGVIGNAQRYTEPATEARIGTLKLDETQLAGYLEMHSQAGEHTPLHWHPTASLGSSPLQASASGAIVYRKALPTLNQKQQVEQRKANRAVPMINIFLGGKREQRAKAQPDTQGNAAPADLSREILFRTGDAIEGLVERVDERGLTFKSEQTSTTFAAHEQVQSVSLNRQLRTTQQSAEKLQRLMTVPRSKKQDPPTHLFVSVTGDYLRGRLVRIENGVVTVEVRLEQLELPAEQVAKIIWLHDREWDEGATEQSEEDTPVAEAKMPFRIHVIGASERGLTFVPQEVRDSNIVGVSELLGDCSAPIDDANQILFGRDIAARVREYREDPWTLSLAQYPRVYLEQDPSGVGDGSIGAGKQSPLVGNPAPAFGLETLGGERFRLQDARKRVVVLDFWASWCGPCVQTMPLVEQAIDELADARLQLVAVNIQEAPARVLRAVESLGLEATVVLDVDGEVAAAYQANAIPQTVIINPQGVVTHVFVGGGNRMVAQFKEALQSVLTEADSSQAESQ